MQSSRILVDGLSRCLCPSINTIIATSPVLFVRKTKELHYAHANSQKPQYGIRRVSTLPHAQRNVQHADLTSQRRQAYDRHTREELHSRLLVLKEQHGSFLELAELVEYLITKRHEKPSAIHYGALIAANCDAQHGSADVVRTLLLEMKQYKIGVDASISHSILQVSDPCFSTNRH